MSKTSVSPAGQTFLPCTPKRLPAELLEKAAANAVRQNPLNFSPIHKLARLMPGFDHQDLARLSVVTSKYWGFGGVRLTVSFMDNPEAALRRHIVSHMNAWSKTANVTFVETKSRGHVRISRAEGGYWSYVGTDIRLIPLGEQTMNLEGFTMNTPEREFTRVVRHETGHTLGCPHEHMRKGIIADLDVAKATKYFMDTQGWTADEVKRQVLTPLEEESLRGTPFVDQNSIMCYHLPGSITKTGKPILGGPDITSTDFKFLGSVYPKPPKSAKGLQPPTPKLVPDAATQPNTAKKVKKTKKGTRS